MSENNYIAKGKVAKECLDCGEVTHVFPNSQRLLCIKCSNARDKIKQKELRERRKGELGITGKRKVIVENRF